MNDSFIEVGVSNIFIPNPLKQSPMLPESFRDKFDEMAKIEGNSVAGGTDGHRMGADLGPPGVGE